MMRVLFVSIAVVSFGFAGVLALNEISTADVPVNAVVTVATMPPNPPRLPALKLPRELFVSDDSAGAIGADGQTLATPAPGAATSTVPASFPVGVLAVSVDGTSAYAVMQTGTGTTIAHAGDVVQGKRIVAITDQGVSFEGNIFVPLGITTQNSVPPVGGAVPLGNQTVPVNIGATPAPTAAPIGSAPGVNTTTGGQQVRVLRQPRALATPSAGGSQNTVRTVDPSAAPTPDIINPLSPGGSPP